MLRAIQNHPINARGITLLNVSKGTEFMQAMMQRDTIVLLGIGPITGEFEQREIHAFFSGYALPDEQENEEYRYLGTAMLRGEAPVHIFERVQLFAQQVPEPEPHVKT